MTAMDEEAQAAILGQIEVVLVEPQGPRNVGSVARAMRNFGLHSLCTVRGVDPTHPEALEMGVHSHELLASTRRVDDLDAALEPASYVVSTTGKPRDRLHTLTPRQAAPRILEEASRGRVAIVFGREDHGLDGRDLRQSHDCIAIATSPGCRALNLSQAMLLIAYEIYDTVRGHQKVAWSDGGRMANGEMRNRLKADLTEALELTGIQHEGTEISTQQSLERLIALTPMQSRDARLLFALARQVRELAGKRRKDDEDAG